MRKWDRCASLPYEFLQKRTNPFGADPTKITVADVKRVLKTYALENEFKVGNEMPREGNT